MHIIQIIQKICLQLCFFLIISVNAMGYTTNHQLVIPYKDIKPYLTDIEFFAPGDVTEVPQLIGNKEDYVTAVTGQKVYALGISQSYREPLYALYRPDKPILDAVTHRPIAFPAYFIGNANRIKDNGPISTLQITHALREIENGDFVLPDHHVAEHKKFFVAQSPTTPVKAHIAAVVDGMHHTGQYSVVVVDKGELNQITPGTLLTIFRQNDMTKHIKFQAEAHNYKFPDEPVGQLVIYKSCSQLSLGLIVNATDSIQVGDILKASTTASPTVRKYS